MALTNAERQQRYRDRKKQQLIAGAKPRTVDEYNATQRKATFQSLDQGEQEQERQRRIDALRESQRIIEEETGKAERAKRLLERKRERDEALQQAEPEENNSFAWKVNSNALFIVAPILFLIGMMLLTRSHHRNDHQLSAKNVTSHNVTNHNVTSHSPAANNSLPIAAISHLNSLQNNGYHTSLDTGF